MSDPERELIAAASVFLVRDVKAAADFYRDVLGFEYDGFHGEPPDFCMVWRKPFCVMLSQVKAQLIRPVSSVHAPVWDAYFWVHDAQAQFEDFRAKGAKFAYEPTVKVYGNLEFAVRDRDGYILAFGEDQS